MRATLPFLRAKFREYNALCFGSDPLPIPNFRINHARTHLGSYRYSVGERQVPVLTLSDCFDLPQQTLEDTIIHEMIHMFIHVKGVKDDAPHGTKFLHIMNSINRRHGRHISVTHKGSEAEKATDLRPRLNIVCLVEFSDGTFGLTVTTEAYVKEIDRTFRQHPQIKAHRWYKAFHSHFNRYQRVRTPRVIRLTSEQLTELMAVLPK